MLELLVAVYALSYVVMELVWLHRKLGSYMEDIIKPSTDYATKTIAIVLLPGLAPVWTILVMLEIEEMEDVKWERE